MPKDESGKLHDTIEKIVEKTVQRERGELDVRSAIDASYASGNPKTLRPGESVAANDLKRILLTTLQFWPGDDVVEIEIGGDTVLVKIADVPGNPNTGAYILLPVPMPSSTAFTVPTQTADQVRCFHFTADKILKLKWIVHEVVTAAGGSHGAFGIYTSDRAIKLFDTGAEDWAGNGVKPGLVTEGFLFPGCSYWLAWTIDSATPTLRSVAAPANFGVLNDQVVQKGTAANAASAGVLPATLGTITGASFDLPLVKLQGA